VTMKSKHYLRQDLLIGRSETEDDVVVVVERAADAAVASSIASMLTCDNFNVIDYCYGILIKDLEM
jgi:hypothetical protein